MSIIRAQSYLKTFKHVLPELTMWGGLVLIHAQAKPIVISLQDV